MKQTLTSSPLAPRLRTAFMFLLLCVVLQLQATVRYVKPTASGSGDGSSWANASDNLQAMINASGTGDEVWVAAGTYKPTSGTDRTISFVMKNGVGIYGGFNGTETQLSQRNWVTNVTTLSGDIGTAGNNSDNTYNVVFANSTVTGSSVLDGFVISGGNANHPSISTYQRGAGMQNAAASPTVRNCTFQNNAGAWGAGMAIDGAASPSIINCIFSANTSTVNGGGMNLDGGNYSTLVNCVFIGNIAANWGGGIVNANSTLNCTNCSFSGNSAAQGGALRNFHGTSILNNCILWGNNNEIFSLSGSVTVSNSIVQGGWNGTGNLNTDPLFVNPANGNLRLQSCSPAINAGNNAAVPSGITTDFDGNPRFFNSGVVDMGAYELQGTPTPVVANCQPQTVYLGSMGQASLAAAALNNGSTGCGTLAFTVGGQSSLSYTCANIGSPQYTLTVTDARGQTATCTAIVIVIDNENPSITCPANITVNNDPGQCSAVVDYEVTGSDNCSFTLSQTAGQASGTAFPVGTITNTWTATDPAGNSVSCSFTVTALDNENPTITCPAPITVNNDPGQCSAVVNYTVTGSDNCSYFLSQTGGLASGSAFPVGTTTNTWTSTDPSDNTATCSFTVTVLKTGDPDLLWAYTVIAFDEVKMKKNTVQSGGIGMVDTKKDKVKLEGGTLVTAANTFVKSPDITLSGGSLVATHYPGFVPNSLLPAFLPPSANCGNNLDIPDNSAPVTLNLACYGNIKVGKNVTVTFSGHADVNVKDLDLKEGATVLFAQNTILRVNKKLDTGKNVTISRNGNTVWLHVDDAVKIDDGNNISVNMHVRQNLLVDKTAAGNPTFMTGLFIANKVDSKDNVFWNWDPVTCPAAPQPQYLAGLPDFNAQGRELEGELFVDLHWTTRHDHAVETYTVEKSADGIDFQPVAQTGSRYGDDRPRLYRSPDPAPAEGDWLYRLKVVHRDGSIAHTPPQLVRLELPVDFTVFPNPASTEVRVALAGQLGKPALLQLINGQGMVVATQRFDELPAAPVVFSLRQLPDGFYLVNVQVDGKRSRAVRLVVAK